MSEITKRTYYQVLGVHHDAERSVIHAAWKLAARRHHPDRKAHLGETDTSAAMEKMIELNEAWGVLRDPESRRRYDLSIGIREARCSVCGEAGRQRLGARNQTVGLCDRCYQERVS